MRIGRCTRRGSRKDIGRSSVVERKRIGLEIAITKPEGKWNSAASQMVRRFKETGHQAFTRAGALSRGLLRTLKGK